MKFRTLIRRNLCFHWRSHLGVVLGAAVGSAALIGALVVGDSVKGSLRERALHRTDGVWVALRSGDRFFSDALCGKLTDQSNTWMHSFSIQGKGQVPYAGFAAQALQLSATLSKRDGSTRANHVTAFGVDTVFLGIILPRSEVPIIQPDTAWLNSPLAQHLGARVGDEIVFRASKSAAASAEMAIAARSEEAGAVTMRVGGIFPPTHGELNFDSARGVAWNIFVRREELAEHTRLTNRANLIVIDNERWDTAITRWVSFRQRLTESLPFTRRLLNRISFGKPTVTEQGPVTSAKLVTIASNLLASKWSLADAQCALQPIPGFAPAVELRTGRVFLDMPVVQAALAGDPNAQPVLTYLATLLRAGTNATPYSMITAAGAPWTPTDLRDDEIVVSQWLADDLHVKPGDEIAMSYFLPESGAKLVEATNTFRVRSIVPMEMPWTDRTLMPDFPGIEKAESTSEWDAGFPLTYKIRQKDEDYWKQHRGTPKAFITLAAGQKIWGNRFGNLTAIRFAIPTNTYPDRFRADLEKRILANLKPEKLGLRFEPVREQALKAAEESQDVGGLFLGFSFFVIAAALLLMGLLFQLGLEQRAPEIGTLLALGFTPKQVRKLLLREGVALAFIGGILGTLGGIYYAKVMLHGLTTIWRDAVGASALSFHFTAQTLVIGLLASVVVSMITIWLTLRKFVRRPPMQLLNGEIHAVESNVQRLKPKVFAGGALLAALGLVSSAIAKGDTSNAGVFFGAGALVLVSGLCFTSAWLTRLGGAPVSDTARQRDKSNQAGSETGAPITLASLAVRGCARRRKRSLATIAMLACGSFLIVSIGVFRLDANRDATKRSSGTGGFALIGEATMPVVQDLNSQSGREFFALNERDLGGVNFVPFRVREGDEASCLNLNAAQRPKLLGVNPKGLEERFGFAKGDGWQHLQPAISQRLLTSSPTNEIEIPAIGDANSIQWAMHKKVGDTIDYVDERGQPFKVRIVGAVANSILQGQLIIDEAEFVKRFPGESGYRMFLVDAPSNAVSQVSATLSRAMQDVGLELTPTATRLNQFNAVQNTYLGTFQVLGGLGLLLGSVGLGVVVLRNVLERRGELAVMMAVGFRKAMLQRILLIENGALLLAGLALGIVAAAVAVLPALLSANGGLPVTSLAITLGAVLVNGAVWTWVATRLAVRGDLLKALRNE